MMASRVKSLGTVLVCALCMLAAAPAAWSKSAEQIDTEVDAALSKFKNTVTGAEAFLAKADGVLVFPKVIKAGVGLGGAYGEGALRIDGKTVEYYSTASASIGLQLGAQERTEVIVFLEREALDDFRASKGWEAGVDGSIAVAEWGAGESLDTVEFNDPIVGFIFGNRGLMFNLSLEGAKMTKLVR